VQAVPAQQEHTLRAAGQRRHGRILNIKSSGEGAEGREYEVLVGRQKTTPSYPADARWQRSLGMVVAAEFRFVARQGCNAADVSEQQLPLAPFCHAFAGQFGLRRRVMISRNPEYP